jgi:hypothetical protein
VKKCKLGGVSDDCNVEAGSVGRLKKN